MAKVVFTATAQRALKAILAHIAADRPKAALALIDDLQTRTTATLTQFPDAGARYRGEMRFVTVRKYSLIYRHDAVAGVVFVLDVVGPGRDWR